MRTAIILSAVLHVTLFLVAIIGLPRMEKRLASIPEAIPVDIVDVGQLTNTRLDKTPAPPKPAPARPQPAPPRTTPPPPPPTAQAEPPPPPPVRTPEPPKQVAQAEPEPKPEPKPEEPAPKPEPKKEEPKPEPKKEEPKKPEPPKKVAEAPKPEPKKPEPKKPEPKKPEPKKEEPKKEEPKKPDFRSVLKDLEKLKQETPPAPPQEPTEEVAEAPASQAVSRSDRLTISQVDAVRRAIRPCWNVDAGARGVENYLVVVEANMNPDGTVRDARVVSSTVDRASTDRALRALLNPRCQPFPLPPDQYQDWKVMTVNFNPQSML